jgi:hypothetical protein
MSKGPLGVFVLVSLRCSAVTPGSPEEVELTRKVFVCDFPFPLLAHAEAKIDSVRPESAD